MRGEQGQQALRVEFIGAERQPVVIVENFAPDPQALIADAASRTFAPMGEFYPGVRAPAPRYFEGHGPLLRRVLREFFDQSGAYESRALYSSATTPSDQLSLAQRIPHIDGLKPGMIAMLHYLAPQTYGGTAFYRHRSTGLETVDALSHERYMAALKADFATHGEPSSSYIQGDTSIFERIARYDSVFNRALIYRSSALHCAELENGVGYPADVRKGRLTVASFLTPA